MIRSAAVRSNYVASNSVTSERERDARECSVTSWCHWYSIRRSFPSHVGFTYTRWINMEGFHFRFILSRTSHARHLHNKAENITANDNVTWKCRAYRQESLTSASGIIEKSDCNRKKWRSSCFRYSSFLFFVDGLSGMILENWLMLPIMVLI